jgi:CheY-like chemotaxis protein
MRFKMAAQAGLVKSVLVVEDDPDFSAFIESVLTHQGYTVTTANNGEVGLKMVLEAPPDAITLDLQMPEKSGLDFYRELKSHDAFRRIPVIVITGITRGNPVTIDFVRAFLVPAPEAYIEKPFTDEELTEVLGRVFETNRSPPSSSY